MAENLELCLLCTEDTNFDYEANNDIVSQKLPMLDHEISMGFPFESEEMIRDMIEKEKQHLPRDDYIKKLKNGDFDLNAKRKEALTWIWKVCEEHKFGPLCIYLSINYLDRFLSVHDLPSGVAWAMQLLAVACLSLAAKIEETRVPLLLDLQVGDPRFVFEAKSIQRMELLVLTRLKWRLKVITPFSYISYFLRKLSKYDQEPSNTLISRSLQVIANTTKGIEYLEYRPSEVAAAVALSVTGELRTVLFDYSYFSPLFSLVHKEKVKKIGDRIESNGLGLCSQTPNGVLQLSASCFTF